MTDLAKRVSVHRERIAGPQEICRHEPEQLRELNATERVSLFETLSEGRRLERQLVSPVQLGVVQPYYNRGGKAAAR